MADAKAVYNEGAEGFRDKDKRTVTLKPDSVDVKDDRPNADKMKEKNLSEVPYHTYETEQINAKNFKAAEKDADKEYEFTANGYKVKEADDNADGLEEGLKKFVVTGEDFERVLVGKQNAENFALTHSEAHASMPATVPSN